MKEYFKSASVVLLHGIPLAAAVCSLGYLGTSFVKMEWATIEWIEVRFAITIVVAFSFLLALTEFMDD